MAERHEKKKAEEGFANFLWKMPFNICQKDPNIKKLMLRGWTIGESRSFVPYT